MIKAIRFINLMMNISLRQDSKQVLFLSDVRDTLGGNLKVMYDYIDDKEYKKVVCLKSDRRIKRSVKEKIRLIKMISVSKYILLDDFSASIACMVPRKNQQVVQLWHGPGAFKKIGFSRGDKKRNIFSKYGDHRNYTKAIVTADDIVDCYKEGFGMKNKGKVKATGFPRTDCFFDKDYIEKKQNYFYEQYPELKNKKVVLFAPTYRGENLKVADYDFSKLDLDKIYDALGSEYAFVFKWHPAIYNNMERDILENYDFTKYKDFYYDLSKYRDINDLLLISDILITDYSSVIFDYVLLDKPVIYFTYDLDEYESERGLYFPFKDYVYGSVVKDCSSLIKAIKLEKMEKKKRKEFINKFMVACDGNSTKKTYEFIFECENK